MDEWRSSAAAFAPPREVECRDGHVAMHEYKARPSSAPKARAALRYFLAACEVSVEKVSEILTAAGEAVANSIEHAYDPRESGPFFLSLYCCSEHRRLIVQVRDQGTNRKIDGVPAGRGFGTLIMKALPNHVSVDAGYGTTVTMLFRL